MPRNIIYDWAASIDQAERVDGQSSPQTLFDLTNESIATFPVKKMFHGTNTNIERHFGVKLEDNELVYSVAGVMSSEAIALTNPNHEWMQAPLAPRRLQSGQLSESSVRMYVCIFAGKRAGGFLRFTGSRPLRSKENAISADVETVLECPSWFVVLTWSDHKCEVKIPPPVENDDRSQQFFVVALDVSKKVL